jgi:dolichyl-phosphate-mannose--protein O-mannosyl transferase
MAEIKKNKLKAAIGALVTFVVVGLLAVQAMFYLKGYSPSTNMMNHQFLVSIGFLIGILAASYVYTYLQGDDRSSWLYDKDGKEKY